MVSLGLFETTELGAFWLIGWVIAEFGFWFGLVGTTELKSSCLFSSLQQRLFPISQLFN